MWSSASKTMLAALALGMVSAALAGDAEEEARTNLRQMQSAEELLDIVRDILSTTVMPCMASVGMGPFFSCAFGVVLPTLATGGFDAAESVMPDWDPSAMDFLQIDPDSETFVDDWCETVFANPSNKVMQCVTLVDPAAAKRMFLAFVDGFPGQSCSAFRNLMDEQLGEEDLPSSDESSDETPTRRVLAKERLAEEETPESSDASVFDSPEVSTGLDELKDLQSECEAAEPGITASFRSDVPYSAAAPRTASLLLSVGAMALAFRA